MLEKPETIYRYDRRRQTYVDGSSVKLCEFFKANEHLSRYRYYLFSGYVVRQEQLDAKGRITRVITVNDWRQPAPAPSLTSMTSCLTTERCASSGTRFTIASTTSTRVASQNWSPSAGIEKCD